MPPEGPGNGGDPAEDARSAGLRHVSDSTPGLRRVRRGRGFEYRWPDGRRVTDPEHLARIRSLAVPPAWTDVWISPDERGHLQATGRDARGRKQYRYHPRWREVRDQTKYERMVPFGQSLPRIRRRVRRDLRLPGLPRGKVLATVVRLLDTTLIRVGNDEYAKDNGAYGLTTLRDKHVEVNGSEVRFTFVGKGGKRQEVTLEDRRLVRIVMRCRDLPGYELFQYVDEDGERRAVDSEDVNSYIREVAGDGFTAKDFRTWAGTVLAACALKERGLAETERAAKRNIVRAIESVASTLGNTPAVCRTSYVHPEVLEAYRDRSLFEVPRKVPERVARRTTGLRAEEREVLEFLRKRLRRNAKAA